jgi:hypothetical protein
MGLIKEPATVDFTVLSKTWTAEEQQEFSELIRRRKTALASFLRHANVLSPSRLSGTTDMCNQ